MGRAIESDRPLHLSLGGAGIGGENTMSALAGAELAYHVIWQAAIGDDSPIMTVSDPTSLPLAQDTLRRAYEARNLKARYQPFKAQWYPAGSRSLAFAAAITALMGDENMSSNILAGSYGPELALIMAASQRRDTPAIAVSNQLTGQAIAWAMSETPLIGEEVFVAPSYLDKDGQRTSTAVIMDVLRWLLILAMLGGVVATIAGNGG